MQKKVTYNELCNVENTMQRAVHAARYFAGQQDMIHMQHGMNIVANVRNAGMYLLDDTDSIEVKQRVAHNLLIHLFGTNPFKSETGE